MERTAESVDLDPAVAALAEGLVAGDDGLGVVFSPDSLERARVALRNNASDEVIEHLAILAARIERVVDDAGAVAIAQLGRLVGEILAVREATIAPTLETNEREHGRLLGRSSETRAPRADPAPAPPLPKPRRGL